LPGTAWYVICPGSVVVVLGYGGVVVVVFIFLPKIIFQTTDFWQCWKKFK
jgi:hypothetical protein